jgi:hypothetical protein
VQIVQSIEYARKKREKLDWRVLMERAIEAELLQGMPQTDIKYLNPDTNEAALHKLYNVSVGIESRPQTKPYYEPGKGGKPRTEDEYKKETTTETQDYSDYLVDYPSTTELTQELKKGFDSGTFRKVRKATEYESMEEFESETEDSNIIRPESFKQLRDEKEKERKRLAEMVKNSEYMLTRKNVRDKKAAEKLGVHNTVTETTKKTTTDNKDNSKPQFRQRTPSRDRTAARDRIPSRDRTQNRDDRNRQSDRRGSLTEETGQTAETGETIETEGMTETGTATGVETEVTMTGIQTETGTDNSIEVGTGRTPETKTETGHNRETGTQDKNGDTRDRGRSRERRQERTTKTNYASTDRFRSGSRPREIRDRSDSRNMRLRGITRSDFEAQRGIYFKRDYRFDNSRTECDKCGSWQHHPWSCNKYNKYAPNECTICNKGLHHWEVDCMGNFRDPETSYPRGRVTRRYDSRERTPERDRTRL